MKKIIFLLTIVLFVTSSCKVSAQNVGNPSIEQVKTYIQKRLDEFRPGTFKVISIKKINGARLQKGYTYHVIFFEAEIETLIKPKKIERGFYSGNPEEFLGYKVESHENKDAAEILTQTSPGDITLIRGKDFSILTDNGWDNNFEAKDYSNSY